MSVEIRHVTTRRDLNTFIRLPWAIYRNRPLWVPPLKFDVRHRLDRSRNPFFEHAEAEYFLAFRDGDPVGRISAHYDRNFNEFQDNEWGMFGFFEAEDDQEVATALLETAEAWLRERGHPILGVTIDPPGQLDEPLQVPAGPDRLDLYRCHPAGP